MEYLETLIQSAGMLGYVALFFIVFGETLPFGFFLPGDVLLFTAGLLAADGAVLFPLVAGLSFAGSFLGYLCGYFLGRRLCDSISREEYPLWLSEKRIERTQQFFDRYGDLSVALCRFVPVVRSCAPLFAGVIAMSFRRFVFASLLGSALWAGLFTTLGFYLGTLFPNAHFYILPIILVLMFVFFLPTIVRYFRTKAKPVTIENV
jgi:membrane-associated protein